jgi:hypothetical protein
VSFLKQAYAITIFSLRLRIPLSTFESLNQSLWNSVCVLWNLSPCQRRTSLIPPLACVFVCVSLQSFQGNGSVKFIPPFYAKQRLGRHLPTAKNTSYNTRIVGRLIFYAVFVLSKGSLWVCLCILLRLLGNNSVKTFSKEKLLAVLFSILSVSYQKKVCDYFFPKLLVDS